MRRLAAVLVLACLAGCAQTPQQLVESGAAREVASTTPPALMAGCIARRTEERTGLIASNRAGPGPQDHEVVVRIVGKEDTLAVMRISPNGTGSITRAWFGQNISAKGSEEFLHYSTKGC